MLSHISSINSVSLSLMCASFLSFYKLHDTPFPLLWCRAFTFHLSKFWSHMLYFYSAISSGSQWLQRNLYSFAQPWWVYFHKIFLLQQVKHMSQQGFFSWSRHTFPSAQFYIYKQHDYTQLFNNEQLQRASMCMFTVRCILSATRYCKTNRISNIYIFFTLPFK